MAFSKGTTNISLDDIKAVVSEYDIAAYYLGITKVPTVIQSPLRKDKRPSFGLYVRKNDRIFYHDFSTGEKGGLYDLLSQIWGLNYHKVIEKIYSDINKISPHSDLKMCDVKNKCAKNIVSNSTELLCKTREWRDYDIKYWESYGITLKWLKYANVYPISHKIIVKDDKTYTFKADKYAYAYVEHKDKKTTLKIYQPFNTVGFKWSNKHDSSVISLWTKIPKKGDILCICSSLKDALCLWANTGIPCINPQGEGYRLSNTVINQLKERFKKVYIMFDNDNAGELNSDTLSQQTGFTKISLPKFEEYGNPKDISDLYKAINNKELFKTLLLNIFNYEQARNLQKN